MDYTADKLHYVSSDDPTASVFARVSAEQAGWKFLNMVALRLETGKTFGITIDQYEYAAIILGGVCDIRTNRGNFEDVGRRPDVFTGMPYAIYMPRNTEFEIESLSDDFAMASCWVPTDQDHPVKLITPQDVSVEILGGGNASYQVNTVIAPGFGCHRLTVREIYTPGGNWSHYPPHKHDTEVKAVNGSINESEQEEIFFYKLDRPHGFALQRIYTDDGSIDATINVAHNDVVIVPRGYHPMVSAHGFTTYTLNIMAGAAPSLAHTIDSHFKWVHETWLSKDPRLPTVDHGMEPYREPETDEA
jgi:5-deoxy-glucuronate isomerase